MPQRCAGFADPAGNEPRQCIFAAGGKGGKAKLNKGRDGEQCVFCSIEALQRALASHVGKGRITKRLQTWRSIGSPTFRAAFAMGSLAVLSEEEQLHLRRAADDLPYFNRTTSWLHKRRARLQSYVHGRPIPPSKAKSLSSSAQSFLFACETFEHRRVQHHAWAKRLRQQVRTITKTRLRKGWPTSLKRSQVKARRAWWQARREIRACLLPYRANRPPYSSAFMWAVEDGILTPP